MDASEVFVLVFVVPYMYLSVICQMYETHQSSEHWGPEQNYWYCVDDI